MNVSLSWKSILHMREQVLVTETTNGGTQAGAVRRFLRPCGFWLTEEKKHGVRKHEGRI